MIKHFFRVVLRMIIRNKMVTTLNVTGLAAGLLCFILIYLLITDELQYDHFHAKAPRLYRIYEEQLSSDGSIFETPMTPTPLAGYLKSTYDKIENAARVGSIWEEMLIDGGGKRFYDNKGYWVDPSFLTMFSFPITAGDAGTALSQPNSMVVTETFARKYFGTADPMGQVIRINDKQVFNITGVLADIPKQSSLEFGFLLPFESQSNFKRMESQWGSNWHYTYIELKPGANASDVSSQIRGAIKANHETSITDLSIQPLLDIRLNTAFNHRTPRIVNLYVFGLIAVLVLLIAIINFVNLSTAHAMQRGKEVGMRKISGASRTTLIRHYLSEAVLLALLAFAIALLFTELMLPFFNQLADKSLVLRDLTTGAWIGLALAVLATGISGGLYPAFYLSGLKPVQVLKGNGSRGKDAGALRKVLVTVQFAVSICLIIGTLVIYRQLEFMKHKDLGFDRNNVIVLPLRGDKALYYNQWKSESSRVDGVIGVSSSEHPLHSFGSNTWDVKWPGRAEGDRVLTTITSADYDFTQVAGIHVKEGRFFDRAFGNDSMSIVINEETVRVMHLDNPVGTNLDFWGGSWRIIGVTEDFHFLSVHREVPPLILMFPQSYGDMAYGIIRLAGPTMPEALAELEKVWHRVNPAFPFDYKFLDENLDRLYTLETTISKLFGAFCALAILISCIGLFGLASHASVRRTKEIGIRKVLGASVGQIIMTLNQDFMKLILLANLVAWPASYYFVNSWLEKFSYRAELSPWIFVFSGLISVIIAGLVVSYHAVRSAVANPVKSLRYE